MQITFLKIYINHLNSDQNSSISYIADPKFNATLAFNYISTSNTTNLPEIKTPSSKSKLYKLEVSNPEVNITSVKQKLTDNCGAIDLEKTNPKNFENYYEFFKLNSTDAPIISSIAQGDNLKISTQGFESNNDFENCIKQNINSESKQEIHPTAEKSVSTVAAVTLLLNTGCQAKIPLYLSLTTPALLTALNYL